MAKIHKNDCSCNTCKTTNNTAKNSPPLDTLAQLGTNDDFEIAALTQKGDKKTLLNRARRKHFTNALVLKLVDAAKNNPNSYLEKKYWNSYHCTEVLWERASGKLVGTFCKNKWCMVCNAIRTATSINKYKNSFKSWEYPHFVTLTQKTVPHENLSAQIDEMQSIFKSISELSKKRHQRKLQDFKLIGIRKLEVEYNPQTHLFHPHYHLITSSSESAKFIHNEWLNRNANAKPQGQDIRAANSGSMIELFKYMTKVISTIPGSKKRAINFNALDHIFNAIRGRRTLQNFGFKLPKSDVKGSGEVDRSEVIAILEWQQELTDWLNVDTYEQLTNYKPARAIQDLFK